MASFFTPVALISVLLVSVSCMEPDRNLEWRRSTAFEWVSIFLNITALDVAKNGARPTVISRRTYIFTTSMYDAWAAFDENALPVDLGKSIRLRRKNVTKEAAQNIAVSYAAYRSLLSIYPNDTNSLQLEMSSKSLDPDDKTMDSSSPSGIGNMAAAAVIQSRDKDNSNHRGDHPGSNGTPYSDYTGYNPVNTAENITNPDRWQPIVFTGPSGAQFTPSYLTPFWGTVKTFGLTSGAQFRPGPPPPVGSQQLQKEVEQVLALNRDMSVEEKANVEFFRDGPQSTSQSGQWLTFGQALSTRDNIRTGVVDKGQHSDRRCRQGTSMISRGI
jgi:hypothetical protein